MNIDLRSIDTTECDRYLIDVRKAIILGVNSPPYDAEEIVAVIDYSPNVRPSTRLNT